MIRRPPRSTLDRSSAASDVYKRQVDEQGNAVMDGEMGEIQIKGNNVFQRYWQRPDATRQAFTAVSYTHLRAHETVLDLVCRLLLEKKNTNNYYKSVH